MGSHEGACFDRRYGSHGADCGGLVLVHWDGSGGVTPLAGTCLVLVCGATYHELRKDVTMNSELDHNALIELAGGDTSCEHVWAYEGHWRTGGTSVLYRSRCTRCRLVRLEREVGDHPDPGDQNTVQYLVEAEDEA